MEGATHFIKVYKGFITGVIRQADIQPITNLWASVEADKFCGNQTIAIWKIKPKKIE